MSRFCVLALLVGVALAIPEGFITFFDSDQCPDGWIPVETAQGRLIVSVSDPEQAGITVGVPLGDQEDRIHVHTYETAVKLSEKDIAAIGCCNDQGASHGTYPISGKVNSSTSGLPFVQLLLCQIEQATLDSVPFGTVAYFSPTVTACPDQWTPFDTASGRFMIPGYDGDGIITSQSLPLSSGEDRIHGHIFNLTITTDDVSYEGIDGCCNDSPAASGTYVSDADADTISSGLPYLQLLTCVSQIPTFNSSFPPGTLLYNEVSCNSGWNATNDVAGRFLVALPENGVPGATFGTNSLRPGESDSPLHDHEFSGSFSTNSCGVGLASGCCGDGYAKNEQYYFNGQTSTDPVDLPYVSVPLCIQFGG